MRVVIDGHARDHVSFLFSLTGFTMVPLVDAVRMLLWNRGMDQVGSGFGFIRITVGPAV
jgi:hypothetical protein